MSTWEPIHHPEARAPSALSRLLAPAHEAIPPAASPSQPHRLPSAVELVRRVAESILGGLF